jgi:hypothetical protein
VALENRVCNHVKASLEEEDRAHDGHGVGGRSLHEQIINGLHFLRNIADFSLARIYFSEPFSSNLLLSDLRKFDGRQFGLKVVNKIDGRENYKLKIKRKHAFGYVIFQ